MVFIKGTGFIPRPTPPLVAPVSPAPQARSTPQPELRVARPRCAGHCLWLWDMGVSENSVPLNPMVLLIIIPIKWL